MLSNSRRSKFIRLSLAAVSMLRRVGRTEFDYRAEHLKVYTDDMLITFSLRMAAQLLQVASSMRDEELVEEARILALKLKHYASP